MWSCEELANVAWVVLHRKEIHSKAQELEMSSLCNGSTTSRRSIVRIEPSSEIGHNRGKKTTSRRSTSSFMETPRTSTPGSHSQSPPKSDVWPARCALKVAWSLRWGGDSECLMGVLHEQVPKKRRDWDTENAMAAS